MKSRSIYQMLLVCMSLLAPSAWGESEGLINWNARIQQECAKQFAQKLEAWPGIAGPNRNRLATALCKDDRVFWPFAAETQSSLAPLLEEKVRRNHSELPLVIGILGPSARENSEAMHAVRDLFYPTSKTLFQWRNSRRPLQEWRSRMDGGLMGGVLVLNLDSPSVSDLELKIDQALEAISFMSNHEMSSYVLALQSSTDVREHFRGVDVKWVEFGAVLTEDCAQKLR